MAAKKTAAKKPTSKAVTTRKTTDLADPEKMPDYIRMDTDRGNDRVRPEDLVIPRLEIAQDISPQVKKRDPKYIEGLEPGMLFNNITGAVYGTEARVIPVFFRREWLIFRDRDVGGGFRGAHDTESAARAALKDLPDNEGPYELVDAAVHFCLLGPEDGEAEEQIAISMTRSKHKVSRQWNTMIKMAGGDRFARGYIIAPVEDQNSKGQDFWNLSVKHSRDGYWASPEEYTRAEKLYEQLKTSSVVVRYDDEGSVSDDEI